MIFCRFLNCRINAMSSVSLNNSDNHTFFLLEWAPYKSEPQPLFSPNRALCKGTR